MQNASRSDLDQVQGEVYDAAIIGGGIYGIMLALEGAARSRRVVLLERGDFGAETSGNSLRTIHGGLRYLQSLDLKRARSSSRQRAWWLRWFPDLVVPIRCLMPLYGGLRSPNIFRAVFPLARALGIIQVPGLTQPPTQVINRTQVLESFPLARDGGLKGGAVWHDAFMPHSEKVIMECLRWAVSAGAVAIDDLECISGSRIDNVWTIEATDHRSNTGVQIRAKTVINAAGPSCNEVATRLRHSPNETFLPTLAWNLILDRPPPSNCSVAVSPPGTNGRTYFIHPYHGRILVGTGHSACTDFSSTVSVDHVNEMLTDLNLAVPGFRLIPSDVAQIFCGFLPGKKVGAGKLLKHPVVRVESGIAHIIGVKFTEAPAVARKVWSTLEGRESSSLPPRPE